MISERFGRGSRTVDLELEAQIEVLRETKRKYENVLHLARALTNHFYSMVQTQHALGDTFADLSQKSPELRVRQHGHLKIYDICCDCHAKLGGWCKPTHVFLSCFWMYNSNCQCLKITCATAYRQKKKLSSSTKRLFFIFFYYKLLCFAT